MDWTRFHHTIILHEIITIPSPAIVETGKNRDFNVCLYDVMLEIPDKKNEP